MEKIKLFLKGLIIGVGKIIPGVSGAMIAISLGIYEKCLNIISKLPKISKRDLKYLFLIFIGILFSMVLTSKLVIFFLSNYYLYTMLLFTGLIAGSLPNLIKEVKGNINKTNLFIVMIVVFIIILMSFINGNKEVVLNKNINSFLSLMGAGFLDAIATVVPGISGTALLMIFGFYNIIMTSYGDIFNISNINHNLFVLFPFILGLIIGVVMVSKIMNYLFLNHKTKTYFLIIGFALSSIISLFLKTFSCEFTLYQLIVGGVLFIIGYFITKKLEN